VSPADSPEAHVPNPPQTPDASEPATEEFARARYPDELAGDGGGTAAGLAQRSAHVTGGAEPGGHFRIYLGVAAGSGKTIAMLDEGQRRHANGADVVIAYIETHGRPVTDIRIGNLETVPRRVVDYRGNPFEEMDIDAVLRRQPQVALVDELAHTNVPGSGRHEKRWQDVLELLDAEINVVATVNIQHLESIADAAEAITGVRVRERIPDWVVREADRIELLDTSPEQLRRRMLNGNIYPPEQVPQALGHFFRVENLAALRQLALRFMGGGTEGEFLRNVARYRALGAWRTNERVMAGVTQEPGADAIVRHAARVAEMSHADLDVVYVTSSSDGRGRDEHLAQLRQLTSDVGGSWHILHAEDVPNALIEFAQDEQITQMVLGASDRSRWQELISGGSTVKQISRLAARVGIDVHIVAGR
jgi:two-component system, OmpR family, sensor histidine kinase KdpD